MRVQYQTFRKTILLAVFASGALLTSVGVVAKETVKISPTDAIIYGKSYPQWVGEFWKWALALPVEGHPFLDTNPVYDLSKNQSGNVWFWSAPDGPLTRTSTIPLGTSLFLTLRDVECSSLEAPDSGFHGDTEQEQRDCAKFWADHIVNVFCVIDGEAVEDLSSYRFSGTQAQINAPTPWVFGDIGGTGTSVGDGYFLMLKSLKRGTHTIHYGGTFHFDAGELGPDPVDLPKDISIVLTVE